MAKNTEKDRARSAYMRAHGIVRTVGRCEGCLRHVTVHSWKSKWTHLCRG